MSNGNRHVANFAPDIWGDIFCSVPSEMDLDSATKLQHENLKQEVKKMLASTMDKSSQKLHFIDAVQRLGVAYHFEKEIEAALESIYHDRNDIESDDLYTTAIQFRLLREHGFNVHCEVFNKFKDEKGNFKASLITDVRGLLELYEAAHFQVHGENILEEALGFTASHLKLAVTSMVDSPLLTEVANALNRALRKSLPRWVARRYISIYEGYGTQDENLMKFAKLDFKMLQFLHRKEIRELYRWWKGLDVTTNFPFIRDRLVEGYLWIFGLYFEPHYSLARMLTTKVALLLLIMDDIYDAYGTQEELEILTKAVHRWDVSCIDQLPDYLKFFYSELLSLYKEMEDLMTKQGKLYRVQLCKEAMQTQCQAYYDEAQWLHENRIPALEEYLSVAVVTIAQRLLAVASFVGMEDTITEDTFIWALNDPKILRAASIVARLMDDIVSHKFEQERGHAPSAVECYMKQYGVSEERACYELNKKITDAWKDTNEEFLKPTAVPVSALNRILNLMRVVDIFERGEDAFTHVGEEVKTIITSLFIDPIPV